MKKLIALWTLSLACAFSAAAAEPTVANRQTASNYYAYPYPELPLPALTAAPAGYEPFHMEHYGRHGSRWHIGRHVYREPIDLLRPAERQGKLTPRGKELMEQLRVIEIASRGRDGELTPKGARQHRGIARRMTGNFPAIFVDGAYINARSTDVVRCILSMDNELQEIKAYNPNVDVVSDASKSTVYILNYDDHAADSILNRSWSHTDKLAKRLEPDYAAFAAQLIDDPQFIADSIRTKDLYHSIFRIAANAQSHDDQVAPYDLFTDGQLRNQWEVDNAGWFMRYGNNNITKGSGPMRQRFLLRNIIESADTALTASTPGANLRFGHEVALMPLAVLMDLDGLGMHIDDLEQVADRWQNYTIFPMAGNIQLVFYRPIGRPYTADEVLVKALLNERETTLPATPVDGPYYRWADLRAAYLDILGSDGGVAPAPQPY